MIKSGADLNVVTDKGSSALVEAVKKKNLELVQMLLTYGAFMYHKDKNLVMQSPFVVALKIQSVESTELFCDHGADLSMKIEDG